MNPLRESKRVKWRSVADDPPPSDATVIVHEGGDVFSDYFWRTIDGETMWCEAVKPTHWMPLPEPPGDE